MDSWLSQDLATELIRERIAETTAQLRTDELVRQARPATGQPHAANPDPARATGVRRALANALRGFAVRLDSSQATPRR